MTREEYQAKQAERLASCRGNVQDYNAAIGEKRYDDAAAINAKIDEDVAEYNLIAQKLCFDECAQAEDPMRAAVLKLAYPVIGVKDTMTGDEVKIAKRVIIGDPDDEDSKAKLQTIDPLKLQKYCKDHYNKGIGHAENWNNMVERLNMLFALDCAVKLGKTQEFLTDMASCIYVKEASRQLDLGIKNPEAGKPVSNTGLLNAVKAVITGMIGEEFGNRALTHDVKFLKIATAKKSRKALTIQCSTSKYMRGYMMEVCHRVMTGKVYDVDYKKVKEK